MCGKFTQILAWSELVEAAALAASIGLGPVETVTPMRFASVITLDDAKRRRSVRMRWGLIPPSTRDPARTKPHIHARAESIDVKPRFCEAFRHRRGLVVVSTFNEGREITLTKTEQHVLTPQDRKPVAIAVIWERWGEPPQLHSFAMVTVPPNDLIGRITERMPALVEEKDWPLWLGEVPGSPGEVKALLRTSLRRLDMEIEKKKKPNDDQPTLL